MLKLEKIRNIYIILGKFGKESYVCSKGKPKGFTVFIPRGSMVFKTWINLFSLTSRVLGLALSNPIDTFDT